MVVDNKIGLWSFRADISDICEDEELKKAGLWIEFRAMNKKEMMEYKALDAESAVEATNGIVIDYTDDKGKDRRRSISPDALKKRNEFLDAMVCKCIIGHNFEKDENKLMSNMDAWEWLGNRPPICDWLIEQWLEKHPFLRKEEKKKE
jgi:hypothetical protein